MCMGLRRWPVPVAVLIVLAVPAPAGAAVGDLPVDLPGLPDLPVDLPGGLPGDDVPGGGLPGGELPGGLPGLPGLPGSGSQTGTDPGSEVSPGTGDTTQGGALDASGPVIAGPSKAATVRVDSKGRFRLTGVKVTCPTACTLSVRVSTTNGGTVQFVKRSYKLAPGGSLKLKKLKVTNKGLRALRSMGVARVVANLNASAGSHPVSRGIGLKLKPAKRAKKR